MYLKTEYCVSDVLYLSPAHTIPGIKKSNIKSNQPTQMYPMIYRTK